jgi:hypothetical protein
MVSILNNYNQIFDIIEHKTSLLEDNLLVIKKENQRIVLDNIRINQKIDKIELDLLKKDEEIKELKEDNQKIDKVELDLLKKDEEIKELKEIIKKQNIKIDNLEFNILKNKIFEALSDIINNEKLEDQISEIYDDLNYLKSSRNNLCHYIRNNDSKDIKNKKIAVTIDVLKNISIETKNELISEFDNDIIEKIIDYYEQNKLFINSTNISQKELIRINNWWK